MSNRTKNIAAIVVMVLSVLTCTNKLELSDSIPTTPGGGNIGDTLYVQQFPIWGGYNKPQDIIVGREPFIYVADTENDRIVMLNVAGQIMGVKTINTR